MIIAGLDVGYRNIDRYYVFKSAVMYYIYDSQMSLVDKRIQIGTRIEYLKNMYEVDNMRVMIEREVAERIEADYVLIDGSLENRFMNMRVRRDRYWIPKRIENDVVEEDGEIIVRSFGNQDVRYRIETFQENKDRIDSLIQLLSGSVFVYPFILLEADKYSVVKNSDIPINLKLLTFSNKIHRRVLR
ncbi:MAG: hypothetical protein N3C61_03165 [Candidatus Micrarchaeota archaeon]|nr:hypothetical protein [Candidatus Micrarchaeota archaeon]